MIESKLGIKKYDNIAELNICYEEDKLNDGDKILGYGGIRYKPLIDDLDGIQEGITIVLAQSNVGKTTMLLSMAIDIVENHCKDAKPPRVAIYTFDDPLKKCFRNLISCITQIPRKIISRKRVTPEKEEQVKAGKDALEGLMNAGIVDILCRKNIETWGNFVANVEKQYQINPKLIVVIDGISQIEYDKATKRLESNEAKSSDLKALAARLNIPILLSQEVPKGNIVRPTKEDVAETRRWCYDADVIICLSNLDNKTRDESVRLNQKLHQEVVVSIEKSKTGSTLFHFGLLRNDIYQIEFIKSTPELLIRKNNYEKGIKWELGKDYSGKTKEKK